MREDTPTIADAGHPAEVVNPLGSSPIVLVCEHASRYIPQPLGALGLDAKALNSHIAWDIGAEDLSRRLVERFDATLVVQRYSRLVYDCNRPPDRPDAMPEISEAIVIPGNRNLSVQDRDARIEQIYEPFHAAVGEVIGRKAARGTMPILITVHSFTPVYKGIAREFELGVLHDSDDVVANALLSKSAERNDFETRRNEPYGPQDGVTHTLNLHGNSKGLRNVMLEVRNDLISETDGQAIWADRLFELLNPAVVSLQAGAEFSVVDMSEAAVRK